LRPPDHFSQAFDERVQRRVRIAVLVAEPRVLRRDAGRLVDR